MSAFAAFVPIESWHYNSPDVLNAGKRVDLGLLAEALILFERVYFAFTNPEHLADVVAWFHAQGHFPALLGLVSDGILVPYYYSFASLPGHVGDVWNIMNIQDQEAARCQVFEKRILASGQLRGLLPQNYLIPFTEAALRQHVEVKADDFGSAIENARLDYGTEDGASFLLQIFVDELYRKLGYVKPPTVRTRIKEEGDHRVIDWGMNFDEVSEKLGPNLHFHAGIPLAGAAFGAKTLWSAAQLTADLYLGSPITAYAAHKLAQGSRSARVGEIVERLIENVEFPNIRTLTNEEQVTISAVLELRRKAARFRDWLRSERELDRDAVRAYLGEIAATAGWTRHLGIAIHAAGLFGGAAVSGLAGSVLGPVKGGAAGAGVNFIFDLAAKFSSGWKPVVFGKWARRRIEREGD